MGRSLALLHLQSATHNGSRVQWLWLWDYCWSLFFSVTFLNTRESMTQLLLSILHRIQIKERPKNGQKSCMSWKKLGNTSPISKCWATFKAEILRCVRTQPPRTLFKMQVSEPSQSWFVATGWIQGIYTIKFQGWCRWYAGHIWEALLWGSRKPFTKTARFWFNTLSKDLEVSKRAAQSGTH